jgi:hypothetical protein
MGLAKHKLGQMDARLDRAQRQAVRNSLCSASSLGFVRRQRPQAQAFHVKPLRQRNAVSGSMQLG